MIYITALIAVTATVFLIGIAVQLIRMEKNLSDIAIFVEYHVSKVIHPTMPNSGGSKQNSDPKIDPMKALFG